MPDASPVVPSMVPQSTSAISIGGGMNLVIQNDVLFNNDVVIKPSMTCQNRIAIHVIEKEVLYRISTYPH